MNRKGYRGLLEYRRDRAREELDQLSSEIFERDATPTLEEWDEMDGLRARIDGYTELLNHFFRPVEVLPPIRMKLH